MDMKIAYFMDYGKNFGGAYTTLLHQIALIKKLGHKVIVFFSNYYGEEMSDEYQKICLNFDIEYEWQTYRISPQPGDIDIICIDKNYECLRDAIVRHNPDLLHSVQINPLVELISRELGIPHIMNIYQMDPEFFGLKYMNIFPYYHICDSWYYAKRWHQCLNTDSICIRTVADEAFQKKDFNKKKINFICVGSICKRKNQLSVIKAFHKVLEYGVEAGLTLCGYADGKYCNECMQYVEDNQLQEKIIFKGFCTDMSNEYLQNEVLICGSKVESYPNAISEAMANGLIIISTPVAGVPEVIEDGKNGYLTRDYSVDAIYEKIVQAIEDIADKRIEEILNNAQNTFLENHSAQIVMGQLIKYYQYVLDDYEQRKKSRNKIVKIEDFRICFQGIIKMFNESKLKLTYIEEISNKLWYLYHITDIVNDMDMQGKELYIWGAGQYGLVVKEMVSVFFPQISIKGFVDSKQRGEFYGYILYAPEEILIKDNIVVFIAAINGQEEMVEKLKIMNKCLNRDYFILAPIIW
ncbi:MAG: glycosyltransferase [Muribaculaceae bacterium]|nr:glycosyltransferase [Muribaculaceae bacterium]